MAALRPQAQVGAAERARSAARRGAPACTARRSDQAPAQTSACPASSTPPACAMRIARPFGAMPVTSLPRSTRPPASSSSARKARATAVKSTMPVSGECSAAMPRGGGLELRAARRARSVAAPATPLARAAALELVEAGQLGLVERDDQLAAALGGDRVALAERVQLARAADAQLRLQRAGRVVDAGVDDAGVAAGLVAADLVLLVEHHDRGARVAAGELARGGQADDAGADDRDVAARRRVTQRAVRRRPRGSPSRIPDSGSWIRATASERERASILRNADDRCVLTVLSARKSLPAISRLVMPSTTQREDLLLAVRQRPRGDLLAEHDRAPPAGRRAPRGRWARARARARRRGRSRSRRRAARVAARRSGGRRA